MYCDSVIHCPSVQELSSHVGLNVAQASSDSIGAREIQDLIDKDVPQVIPYYTVVCISFDMNTTRDI